MAWSIPIGKRMMLFGSDKFGRKYMELAHRCGELVSLPTYRLTFDMSITNFFQYSYYCKGRTLFVWPIQIDIHW